MPMSDQIMMTLHIPHSRKSKINELCKRSREQPEKRAWCCFLFVKLFLELIWRFTNGFTLGIILHVMKQVKFKIVKALS